MDWRRMTAAGLCVLLIASELAWSHLPIEPAVTRCSTSGGRAAFGRKTGSPLWSKSQ